MRRGARRRPVARRMAANFLVARRTSAVVCDGTGDTRTPYAVEAMGDGRNSAMSRKISANRFRGIETSAIWNAT
jgi:ATP-dependent protease HslVU (ClpYQ) peptidase subunit